MKSFDSYCLAALFLILPRTALSQTPYPSQWLADLQSTEPSVRAQAFYNLDDVGFGSSDALRLAAIGLLDRENTNTNLPQPSRVDDEGYAEYYGDVIQAVVSLNDSRSISALVGAMNTGNMAMDAVAHFGTAALDQVLQQLSNRDVTCTGAAGIVIGKMIDAKAVTDPTSRAKVRSSMLLAAANPDYYAGLFAIQALTKLFNIPLDRPPVRVQIDIQPGAYPNTINPRSPGVTPVAVLGTATFDPTKLDPATLKFGPGQASVANSTHVGDVNGDNLPDLVLQFSTQASGIACGDTSSLLIGRNTSGQSFVASDSILTVGCH